MDLLDLAHMVIAIDSSWIALRAWKLKRHVKGPIALQTGHTSTRQRSVPVSEIGLPTFSGSKVRVPAGSNMRPRVTRKKGGRPLIFRPSASAFARPEAARSKRRNLLRHKPEVQLAVYEEHRCPYCLEDVNPRDPRGVVECQVCHTLHHKDCWDITGSCQVPHLNT